jgi:hypothetical protein
VAKRPSQQLGRHLNVPEDLTGAKDSDLQGWYDQLAETITAIAEDDDPSEEDINEITRLADTADRIKEEQSERSEAKENRKIRRNKALERINGSDEDDTADPGDEGGQDDQGAGDVDDSEVEVETEAEPVPVAAGTQTTPAGQFRNKGVAMLKSRRPKGNAPRATVPTTVSPWKAAQSQFSSKRQLGADMTAADIADQIVTERYAPMFSRGEHVEQQYVTVARGEKLIRDPEGNTPRVGNDPFQNFGILREAQSRMRTAARSIVASGGSAPAVREDLADSLSSLVASGACCTPLTPMYDFFRVAVPQTPIEDAMATVEAPRGGVRYIVPPDYQRLLAAVGVQNCADNTNPNSPLLKPCLHVDCPEIAEQTVTAISTCVTFGNLQYKTFPEQVEAFMEDLSVAYASTKEVNYLNTIDANSTAVTNDTGYGAMRSLLFDLNLTAIAYRKRHGMPRASMLQVLLPDWTLDMLKSDLVNDGYEGLQWLNVPDSDVIDALKALNLDPVFFNDTASFVASTGNSGTTSAGLVAGTLYTSIPVSSLASSIPAGVVQITSSGGATQQFVTTGAASSATSIPVTSTAANFAYASGSTIAAVTLAPNQKFNQVQSAGTLNPWPGTVTWYMYAPGTFVRMDGGTLDVGLVRDSTLNRTNDLQIFEEEWTGIIFLGLESIKVTSTLTPNGPGAQNITPITLTAGSTAAGIGPAVPELAGVTTTEAGEY